MTKFNAGDRVRHPILGECEVLSLDYTATAAFLRPQCDIERWAPVGDLTLVEQPAPALEPLDFVAPRDAVVPSLSLSKGLPVQFEPIDDDPYGVCPDGSWSLCQGEQDGVWFKPADVPRIHAELCKLRDEATCQHFGASYLDIAGNAVCGRCQTVLRKSGDEPAPWYRSTEQAREAATNMAAVMKRTWTVPLNPYDRAVIEAETGYRAQMVNAVVSQQVRAGGVDTPGTRAEAERWCAMLCECVQKGMEATTEKSRYRCTDQEMWVERLVSSRGSDWIGSHMRGTPLGKP